MTDQNTTSMSQPTGFAVGQRVRVSKRGDGTVPDLVGKLGTVVTTDEPDWVWVKFDNANHTVRRHRWMLAGELEAVQQ